MKTHLLALACLSALATPVMGMTTAITDFVKTDNIYTNLNQQYPNTGPGVPGSSMGVPNATYVFTPQATGVGNPNNLNYVNNGIGFTLTSDAVGRDFAEVGPAGFGVAALSLPIAVANADHLYLLLGAFNGTSFNITLTGTGGASQTFTNIYVPDFNGGTINSVSGDVADQTVFRVLDVGAGGTGNSSNGAYNYYSLTEVGLTLSPSFAGQTLTNAAITSNGYETLVLGATVTSPNVAQGTVPEPSSWALLLVGFGVVGMTIRRRHRLLSVIA